MTQKNFSDIQNFYLLYDDTSTFPEELNTAETEFFYSQELKYLNKRTNLKNDEKYFHFIKKKNLLFLRHSNFCAFVLFCFPLLGFPKFIWKSD